jgi:hypothetical protein
MTAPWLALASLAAYKISVLEGVVHPRSESTDAEKDPNSYKDYFRGREWLCM